MSAKPIDIMPPYPKEERVYHRESPKKKQERKAKSLFLSLVVLAIIALLFYAFIKTDEATPKTSSKPVTADNFELFTSSGNSTFTQTTPIIVHLTDGSLKTSNAIIARDLLLSSDFQIERSDLASEDYQQTVIYYKKGKLAQAQIAQEALKSSFSAALSESNNLAATYDLLIIVGNK